MHSGNVECCNEEVTYRNSNVIYSKPLQAAHSALWYAVSRKQCSRNLAFKFYTGLFADIAG